MNDQEVDPAVEADTSVAPDVTQDQTPEGAEEVDGPQEWPQGADYDPREDPGPVRPEDEEGVEDNAEG